MHSLHLYFARYVRSAFQNAAAYRPNLEMEESRRYSVLDFVRARQQSDLCRFLICSSVNESSDVVFNFLNQYATRVLPDQVTGLMLVYPDFVVHVLESVEDNILGMCSHIAKAKPECFGVSKCFPLEIHGSERLYDRWYARKIVGVDEVLEKQNAEEIFKSIDEENFELVKSAYYRLIEGFYSLGSELRVSRAISRTKLSETLDAISAQRNPHLPDKITLTRILESPWGENLETLVEDYWYHVCPKEDDVLWPFPRSQCPLLVVDEAKEKSSGP